MKKRLPFTALELVLVCAVAAILLSISLPAFYNISAGRRITGAMSTIAANVSLARARAVSDNIYTALIFPATKKDNGTAASLGLPEDSKICNTSLRLAEVRKKKISDTSFEFVFVKWLEGSSWESVGDGVVIPNGADNFKEDGQSGAPYEVKKVDFSDVEGDNDKPVEHAIIFSPRGQIMTQATVKPIIIRAAEGSKIPGTSDFTLKKNSDGTVTYAKLTVNPLSGRTAVSYE